MKVKGKGTGWAQLWKRNAVVAAIALFVCMAVYLNWSYEQEAGKILGEAAMVDAETSDPLLQNQSAAATEDSDGILTGTMEEGAAPASDYFATARLNRQQSRDSALTLLQEAAAGEQADQTLKDEANNTIQAMANYTVTEAQIENMVVAKGYTDCVAFIGEESVTIAVAAPVGGITDSDTARIVDVVNQVAGYTASQIKIIEVE